MHLYELSNQYKGLAALAQDPDADEEAISDTLEGLEGDIQAKAEGLLMVVNSIKSDVDVVDAEIKRLQAIKKSRTNRMNSLREYLRFNMDSAGISKITCPLFTITLAKPRKMVNVIDVDRLPDKYTEEVTTLKVDKAALLRDLKAGEVIAGAELLDSQPALLIR
jgi:hypothetical protein